MDNTGKRVTEIPILLIWWKHVNGIILIDISNDVLSLSKQIYYLKVWYRITKVHPRKNTYGLDFTAFYYVVEVYFAHILWDYHYSKYIMSTMASQMTSLVIV